MIDVNHQINAVRRQVGSRVFKAGEARVVTLSQTYDTTVEDLWDACTNPGRAAPRRALPAAGQRGRHDRALRSAQGLRRHLGVRRERQLDRTPADGGP